jgi:hypothetical protein
LFSARSSGVLRMRRTAPPSRGGTSAEDRLHDNGDCRSNPAVTIGAKNTAAQIVVTPKPPTTTIAKGRASRCQGRVPVRAVMALFCWSVASRRGSCRGLGRRQAVPDPHHPRQAALAAVAPTAVMMAAIRWSATGICWPWRPWRRCWRGTVRRWPVRTVPCWPASMWTTATGTVNSAIDGCPQLPVWDRLPPLLFWFLPAAVGAPLTWWALRPAPAATPASRARQPTTASSGQAGSLAGPASGYGYVNHPRVHHDNCY